MELKDIHVETEIYKCRKTGEESCGDDWKTIKTDNGNRYISVLSDGLGSGIKANLLSNMTTTMALNFVKNNLDIKQSSEIIMDTLPVCNERKISYSTFTITDILMTGKTKVIEMDNPELIHLRDNQEVINKKSILFSNKYKERKLHTYDFYAKPEDRIIIFTDGVTQAGLGHTKYKFGWRREGCLSFVKDIIKKDPLISARDLSKKIIEKAITIHPEHKCVDDMSCAVIYFRKPRKLIVLTGPPFKENKDKEFAGLLQNFSGKKVICGGTTANIICRELDKEIKVNLPAKRGKVPPVSEMKDIDLVTEGILTLTETLKQLKNDFIPSLEEPVNRLCNLFMNSDIINFIVGTKINEAHQDPALPIDLGIRRNIIKEIKKILEQKFLKKVHLQYI